MTRTREEDLRPVQGFTIEPNGLYLCQACGWWELPIHVHQHGKDQFYPCRKAAHAHAKALVAKLPDIPSTQNGYGTGHLVFEIDDMTHVKFEVRDNGKFDVEGVYYLRPLTPDKAAKLVAFIAELVK